MLIKLIHPKTGTKREVEETRVNKLELLIRAGYILESKYRPPKPKEEIKPLTAADVVNDFKQDMEDQAKANAPEVAIHVSAAARVLIEENELDPAEIEGSGKDGQITKTDVNAYLAALEEEEEEVVYRNQAGDEIPGEEEVPGPSEEEAE